jgi:hypothetical protein
LPNPTLAQLVNNVSTFTYYSGKGNFVQNKLPFGKDQVGGGDSGQPFVTTTANDVMPGILNTVAEAARDVIRTTKFLVTPKGLLFTAKQMGLQQMTAAPEKLVVAPPVSNQKGNKGNLFNQVKSFISDYITTDPTRKYNPLNQNLLANVAGSFIGQHYARAGFGLHIDEHAKYTYIATENNKNGNNRLVNLLKGMTMGGNNVFPNLNVNDLYVTQKELFSYSGGANSFYGIGKTSIKSYVSTFNAAYEPATVDANVVTISEQDMLLIDPQTSILSIPSETSVGDSFDFSTQDFRAYKRAINPNAFPDYAPNTEVGALPGAYTGVRITLDTPENTKKYNIYSRLGIINTNNYDGFGTNYQDRINAISLYYGEGAIGIGANTQDMNAQVVTADGVRDLIKFRIKALDHNNTSNGVFMVFRAFLNGSITDSITPTWNPIKYVGRGETFYSYDGVTSNINLSFTVAAFSRQEMKPLYQKLTYLKSIMYPDYKANKMRGTIVELTIGDYIKYQPGIINSLTITIPEESPWEIALNSPDQTGQNLDKDMHELPMMLKVDMEFIPIWNFLPKRSVHSTDNDANGTTETWGITPFIGIDKTMDNRDNEWSTVVNKIPVKK